MALDIIANLKNRGIAVNEVNKGTRQIIEMTDSIEDKNVLDRMFVSIFGCDPETDHAKESQTLLRYMVHHSILTFNNRDPLVLGDLFATGQRHTANFFKNFPFLKPGFVSEMCPTEEVSQMNLVTQQMETIRVPVSKSKKKEGQSKSDLAFEFYQENKYKLTTKQIKEHFIKVIGLSQCGSNTYHTSCKKRAGDI